MEKTLTPTTAAEAVANGAQALDDKYPGWWRHIDTDRLNIGSINDCVCAQLDCHYSGNDLPHWTRFAFALTGSACYENYGFRAHTWVTDALDQEWKLVIQARLEADKLPAVARAKEAMLASEQNVIFG